MMKLTSLLALISILILFTVATTGASKIRGHQRIKRIREDDDGTEDMNPEAELQEADENDAKEEQDKQDAAVEQAAESENPIERKQAETAQKNVLHKQSPHLAKLASEVFKDAPIDQANVKMAVKEMKQGGPKPLWEKSLGKRYWKYGMCTSSTFWGVAGFGAPWTVHASQLSHVNKIKVDGQEVRTVDPVFGVLNADYFSVFDNLQAAQNCEKPMIIHSVKNMVEVRSASQYFITSQKAGIDGSGGGAPPAKGMEYCFRVVSKSLKISTSPASKRDVDVYCTEMHSDRVQWVESTRKQMELKQVTSLDGTKDSESVELRMKATKLFPPAPKSICGEKSGSPCLTSLPVNVPPPNATEDFKAQPALAVMEQPRYSRAVPIKAAYDQKWEVERVSLADLLTEKDQDGKPLEDKKSSPKKKGSLLDSKVAKSKDNHPGAVRICNVPRNGATKRCLTLEPSVQKQGLIPKPPRRFQYCPGNNLKCFNIESIKQGMKPFKGMSKPCQDACNAENAKAVEVKEDGSTEATANKPCAGWNFMRAEDAVNYGGNGFARCCLKNTTDASSCRTNTCCDVHFEDEVMHGLVTVDAGKTPGIINRIVMKDKHEPNAPWRTTQHWEIIPVGTGEYSNTHAQLKLVYGGLCLSRTDESSGSADDSNSEDRKYGLTMVKCVDPKKPSEVIDIPKNQIFAFHGFAEESAELKPAFNGEVAAAEDLEKKKEAVKSVLEVERR